MEAKQLIVLALQVSIWATVFSFGLKVREAGFLADRPNLLARAIVAMLVVMPVIALIIARVFSFEPAVEVALVALALSPVPPLLPGKETKGGGSGAFAVGLLAAIGLLSIISIPASLEVFERLFGYPLAISTSAIAGVVLKSIIAPLLLGVALRAFAPALADSLEKPVSALAKVLLVAGVIPLLVFIFPTVIQLATGEMLLAIVLFNIAGFTVGHLMGGPDPDQAVVLAMSTASRHPMIAITIATANLADPRVGGIVVLALLINVVIGAIYLAWHRRHHPVAAVDIGPRHA